MRSKGSGHNRVSSNLAIQVSSIVVAGALLWSVPASADVLLLAAGGGGGSFVWAPGPTPGAGLAGLAALALAGLYARTRRA